MKIKIEVISIPTSSVVELPDGAEPLGVFPYTDGWKLAVYIPLDEGAADNEVPCISNGLGAEQTPKE